MKGRKSAFEKRLTKILRQNKHNRKELLSALLKLFGTRLESIDVGQTKLVQDQPGFMVDGKNIVNDVAMELRRVIANGELTQNEAEELASMLAAVLCAGLSRNEVEVDFIIPMREFISNQRDYVGGVVVLPSSVKDAIQKIKPYLNKDQSIKKDVVITVVAENWEQKLELEKGLEKKFGASKVKEKFIFRDGSRYNSFGDLLSEDSYHKDLQWRGIWTAPMLRVLVSPTRQLPKNYFVLSEEVTKLYLADNPEFSLRVYLITETLEAVPIPTSELPNWEKIRQALIDA
jgi:hypothetical protein